MHSPAQRKTKKGKKNATRPTATKTTQSNYIHIDSSEEQDTSMEMNENENSSKPKEDKLHEKTVFNEFVFCPNCLSKVVFSEDKCENCDLIDFNVKEYRKEYTKLYELMEALESTKQLPPNPDTETFTMYMRGVKFGIGFDSIFGELDLKKLSLYCDDEGLLSIADHRVKIYEKVQKWIEEVVASRSVPEKYKVLFSRANLTRKYLHDELIKIDTLEMEIGTKMRQLKEWKLSEHIDLTNLMKSEAKEYSEFAKLLKHLYTSSYRQKLQMKIALSK